MKLSLEKTKNVVIPNDSDNGFITIRALTADEIAEIESKSMTVTLVGGSNNGSVEVNPYNRDNGIASGCLKGWGNLYDASGNVLDYNKSNVAMAKKNLVLDIDGVKTRFFKWVSDEHEKFVNEVKLEEGDAAGN